VTQSRYEPKASGLGARQWLGKSLLLLLAIGAAAYAIVPLVLILVASFAKNIPAVMADWDPVRIGALLPPGGLTTANYTGALQGEFGTALVNSLIVAAVTVVIGLIMSILAAYALAVLRFRFRELVFALVVISFLVPFDLVSIPLSGTFRGWGLSDSLVGLIIPGLGNGLAVFLLRQFFLGIPRDLVDAGRVDGASNRRLIFSVFVPLSKPAVIAAGVILFLAQWGEYLWPLLIIEDPSKEVAPIAQAEFVTLQATNFGGMFASAILSTALPMLAIFLLQRYFRQTVVSEGK
jgi:putative chitobiose transport system permease protein